MIAELDELSNFDSILIWEIPIFRHSDEILEILVNYLLKRVKINHSAESKLFEPSEQFMKRALNDFQFSDVREFGQIDLSSLFRMDHFKQKKAITPELLNRITTHDDFASEILWGFANVERQLRPFSGEN
jgi:hypothetical protein